MALKPDDLRLWPTFFSANGESSCGHQRDFSTFCCIHIDFSSDSIALRCAMTFQLLFHNSKIIEHEFPQKQNEPRRKSVFEAKSKFLMDSCRRRKNQKILVEGHGKLVNGGGARSQKTAFPRWKIKKFVVWT
jgi:hypothetical protein